jgi:hypothetical protein
MLRQLAEKHREEEIQKMKAVDEYPNDFEDYPEEENNNNYNIFQVLEEKRKNNLIDLVKLCENQLTSNESKQEMKPEGKLESVKEF